MSRFSRLLSGCLWAVLAAAAGAQSFPGQKVTVVVPLPAGGPFDAIARLIAVGLQEKWRQSVIVDNRPGAGGLIGAATVARAAPDGTTLLLSSASIISSTKLFVAAPPFDTETDLRPVSNIFWAPYVITTNASVPAKSFQEFVALARQSGRLNYATTPLTAFHLDNLNLYEKTGVQMTAVPYPGAAPSVLALVRNDVQLWLGSYFAVNGQVKEGKLTALAVSGPNRYSAMPNVPTLRESGVDFVAGFGAGLMAPARTPDAIVERIARDTAEVVRQEAIAAKIREMGFDVVLNTPQQWAQEIDTERTVYTRLARQVGLKPQ